MLNTAPQRVGLMGRRAPTSGQHAPPPAHLGGTALLMVSHRSSLCAFAPGASSPWNLLSPPSHLSTPLQTHIHTFQNQLRVISFRKNFPSPFHSFVHSLIHPFSILLFKTSHVPSMTLDTETQQGAKSTWTQPLWNLGCNEETHITQRARHIMI